jgi:hypothetical protein
VCIFFRHNNTDCNGYIAGGALGYHFAKHNYSDCRTVTDGNGNERRGPFSPWRHRHCGENRVNKSTDVDIAQTINDKFEQWKAEIAMVRCIQVAMVLSVSSNRSYFFRQNQQKLDQLPAQSTDLANTTDLSALRKQTADLVRH